MLAGPLLRILVPVRGRALIPVPLARLIGDQSGAGVIASATYACSLSLFLITNFMVWADRHYVSSHARWAVDLRFPRGTGRQHIVRVVWVIV